MPSSVAKAESNVPSADRIVEAVHYLTRQKACSMAWLGEDLRVRECFGPLTDHLPVGTLVTGAMDALLGLDDDILALRSHPDHPLTLPNVLPVDARSHEERTTLSVYWMPEHAQYLLLVTRSASFADIEYRLAAEVRGRAIAEAEVAAQARVVQRINHELGIANRDLKEFASVISHDLRAPLRGVRYAASDAKAALAANDGEAALAHIEKAMAQARRMGAMLTGLLDYARAGRKTDEAETVSTGELAAEIVSSIQAGTTHAIAIEGTWPTIVTLAEPLDIVLRNLIDNAVKHHDLEDGHIIVRAEQVADRLAISVIDDGPGIAPDWHQAVFQPFRQMADSEHADGAGIGLALVKRTVERFGGRIDLTSDPSVGRGTTFRVAWPLSLSE